MGHVERHEAGPFVHAVLHQRVRNAGGKITHAAPARVQLLRQAHGVQAVPGFRGGVGAVFEPAVAGLGIHLQRRQPARVGLGHAGGAGQPLAVPAAHLAAAGHQPALAGEGTDGVVALGGIHPVEAQRAPFRRLGLLVEDHQGVAGAGAIFSLRLGVLVAPGQPRIGQQAGGELPVALAVLGGDGAYRKLAGDVEAPVGLRVVGKELFQHAAQIQILEHQRVAAVGEQRRPGLDQQPVAGQAAVAAQRRHGGTQAVPAALAPARAGQPQGQRLAQQVVGIQERAGGQHVHLEPERRAYRLAAFEALHHQPLHRGVQADQARVLGRGGQRCQRLPGHGLDVRVRPVYGHRCILQSVMTIGKHG